MTEGLKTAIALANKAAKDSKAYQAMIKQHKIKLPIHSPAEFFNLPITDKKSYIQKNTLKDLVLNKKIPSVVYASSGSSGKPTFWAKGNQQETASAVLHETIFSKIYGIKKEDPTLLIICFSMGVWVAGGFTLASCKVLTEQGWNLTCIAPGIEKADIFFALQHLTKEFKNVILAGYPPFIMDIVTECASKKIALPKDLKILTAGDKFSEDFRNKLLSLTKQKKSFANIIGIYGSADAGAMGFETPLTIAIRREAEKNKHLFRLLFNDFPETPALLQYEPNYIFFESPKNELIFTADSGIPLVRYNIHDQGKVITHEQLGQLLKTLKLKEILKHFNNWNLPFIIKTGRTDVAVNFYALNITPEQIKSTLQNKSISKEINGSYFAYHKMNKSNTKEELGLVLELKNKHQPNKEFARLTANNIANKLASISLEFRKLKQSIGEKALPKITFVQPGSLIKHLKHQHLGLLYIQGKKPKIIQ